MNSGNEIKYLHRKKCVLEEGRKLSIDEIKAENGYVDDAIHYVCTNIGLSRHHFNMHSFPKGKLARMILIHKLVGGVDDFDGRNECIAKVLRSMTCEIPQMGYVLGFCERYNCIMITSGAFADIPTRIFLRYLVDKLGNMSML